MNTRPIVRSYAVKGNEALREWILFSLSTDSRINKYAVLAVDMAYGL